MIRKKNKISPPPYNNNNIILFSSCKGMSYYIDFYLYNNGAKIFFPYFLGYCQ